MLHNYFRHELCINLKSTTMYTREKKIYISRHENTSTWIYQSYLIRSIIFPIFTKPFELSRPEFNINTQAPVNQHGHSSWWRSVDQRGGRSEGRRDTLNHVYHTFVISIRLSSRVLVFFSSWFVWQQGEFDVESMIYWFVGDEKIVLISKPDRPTSAKSYMREKNGIPSGAVLK